MYYQQTAAGTILHFFSSPNVGHPMEVLQGARLSLNGFSHHRFCQDSLAFLAILRVNGIGRSMAKTIVTIAI